MNSCTIRAYMLDPLRPRLLSGARILPSGDTRWVILHAGQSYAPLVPLSPRRNMYANQADLSCEQTEGRKQTSWYNYVRPLQWYRTESAIRTELKRWSSGECHPLESVCWRSPWGRLTSIATLEDHSPPRVFSTNCESRGGIMLEQAYAWEALSAQALTYGEFWQGKEDWPVFWCASNDIELTIIRYEHPEWCFLELPHEVIQQKARREINLLFSEYFVSGAQLSMGQNDEAV